MFRISFLVILLLIIASCKTFYPNVMFKTPKDYEFVNFDSIPPQEYKINLGDRLNLQVFSNDMYGNVKTIVSAFEDGGVGTTQRNTIDYLVRQDSIIILPIIGEINLVGKSIPEAEEILKDFYSKYYEDPFIILKVENRRVFVFAGNSQTAKVINLNNEYMTLIEVLAKAGGLQNTGKSWRVKVIRGDLRNPDIDLIDLETIEGMKKANLIILANDIIYIDPRMSASRGLLAEITPVLALITSLTTTYLLIISLTNKN